MTQKERDILVQHETHLKYIREGIDSIKTCIDKHAIVLGDLEKRTVCNETTISNAYRVIVLLIGGGTIIGGARWLIKLLT